MRIAESELELSAAAALMERHQAGLQALTLSGEPLSLGQMLRWRGEHAYVGALAVRAMDRVMGGAGGSATYNWNPLQRFFRDVHTASGHAYMDIDSALQVYGRQALGLDPTHSWSNPTQRPRQGCGIRWETANSHAFGGFGTRARHDALPSRRRDGASRRRVTIARAVLRLTASPAV